MERTAENFQKILEQYQNFITTPNPDDPNFENKNLASNYLKKLDSNKAYAILYYLDKLGIDRSFLNRVTVDHKIQMLSPDVAGYYSLDQHFISLNSAILKYSSVNTIVHIIYHEALHAGVVKELNGVRVKDEALVEFITTQKMKQTFGRDDFRSGYTSIVRELESLLGVYEDGSGFDINYIFEQINSNNVSMLDQFLEIIVLEPLINSGKAKYLSYSEIEDELKKKWESILHLFPRLINDIDSPERGVHAEALMDVSEYKFQNLLDKAAIEIMNNRNLLLKILSRVVRNLGKYIDDEDSLKLAMRDMGYGYLIDYADYIGFNLFEFLVFEQ